MMGNTHEQAPASESATDPQAQLAASQNATQALAQVGTDPEAAAELIRKHPAQRDPLLSAMHARLGNTFVQQVIHALGHPGHGKADDAAELEAIKADLAQEKQVLTTATATSKAAISGAIALASAPRLKQAADEAAATIARAEGALAADRKELEGVSSEAKKAATFKPATLASKGLEDAINAQAVVLLNALTVPGAPLHVAATAGESYGLDINARATSIATELGRITQLVEASLQAGDAHGGDRLAAADRVRAALVAMSGAERGYVVGVMKINGVADDIVDHYQGKSAALRKQAGPQDFGNGGNASADAAAQGGFSHGTAVPNLKSDQGPKGEALGVGAGQQRKELPGGLKSVTADPSTGQLGVGFGSKAHSGSVGGDLRADDGTARMEGFKGDLSLAKDGPDGGAKGARSTKVSGGFTQSTSPPSYDGVHWTLSWSVSASAGAARSTTVAADKGSGAAGNVDVKGSGSLVKSGTSVYPDQAAAQRAYEDGAFEIKLGDLGSMNTLPDASKAEALQAGESVDIAGQLDAGLGVSGSGSNITVSGSVSGGAATDVKVTKIEGNKVRATIRHNLNDSASGSVGTIGLTGGAGHGGSSASSTTFEFDLSNATGKAAYTQWLKLAHLPPNPGTPGVRQISTGTGSFSSNNVGIGIGIGPVNGTGTNTSTSGEFTETSADGRHQRNTIVGSQTDAVKGFNPITPDKTTRSDTLEITNDTDNGKAAPSQYVIKTAIQARTNADATSQELDKLTGQSNTNGKLQGNASGPTGKWSAEGTYTQAQMKKFEDDVVSGKAHLSSRATDAGNPAADLKAILSDKSKSEHDKQVALATWFAKRGPEASADLRSSLGPPQLNVALDGDKYLTGSTGQGVFEGKRQELEDQLLDPELKGDKVKSLLRDVQALYAEQLEKRDHIANPGNYPELSRDLRHLLVQQVAANYQRVAALRDRVAARAKEEGLGDVSSNKILNQRIGAVNRLRALAQEARGHAVDARAKHNGALSAGHDVPRAELDRTTAPNLADRVLDHKGKDRSGNTQIRDLYQESDGKWAEAQGDVLRAEEAERAMYKEDALSDASQSAAITAAETSLTSYKAAYMAYQSVVAELAKIVKISRPSGLVNWSGYDGPRAQDYGTKD